MEIEFVITGICNFINMKNEDTTIIGPSVLLLKADDDRLLEGHDHGGHEHGDHGHGNPPEPPAPVDNNHIPYLAFDTRLVRVNDDFGFNEVRNAKSYKFLRIDDVEVEIQNHGRGVPVLDSTFDYVIDDADFGIQSPRWNRDAVPRPDGRPRKSVVTAWMRFGRGKMSGGRLCPFKWRITTVTGQTFERHFAEEAVYSYEETEEKIVAVVLRDLEDGKAERRLVFTPVDGCNKVTLFLGNNIAADMDVAVRRKRPTAAISPAGHFAFFNNILDLPPTQMPRLPVGVPTGLPGDDGGGGVDGGICGPKKG
jgi:hypothetical protein